MVAYRRVLNTIYSNQMERLVEALGSALESGWDQPLSMDFVIVPNAVMQGRLSASLVDRFGICSNINFELPAAGIWRLLGSQFQEIKHNRALTPGVLELRIYEHLLNFSNDDWEEQAARQLGEICYDLNQLELLSLAAELALQFDRYLVFRPDWIIEWETGAVRHWQAQLWRKLIRDDELHWARMLDRVQNAGLPNRSLLPKAIHIFALPTVSPGYLSLIEMISREIDVYWYQFNPSREYWVDMDNPRTGRGESDHALLGSLGGALRDQIDLLVELPGQEVDLYQEMPGTTVLQLLQNSILNLDSDLLKEDTSPEDQSIQVLGCASASREVDVCYDQLLALFEHDTTLKPDQILICTPNIQTYLPHIQSRFNSGPVQRRIAYQVSGIRSAKGQQLLSLLSLLTHLDGHWAAEHLIQLLGFPAVQTRFGIDQAGLDRIIRSILQSGLFGPDYTDNKFSWQAGVDRLLENWSQPEPDPLGVFADSRSRLLTGSEDQLESLLAIQAQLRDTQRRFSESRSMQQWLFYFDSLFYFLVGDPEKTEWSALYRLSRQKCQELAGQAGFTAELQFKVFLKLFEKQVESSLSQSSGFHRGVQVSNLPLARLIPARVVYVLGLNDGDFPRGESDNGLDLIESSGYRKGDRNDRRNDRLVFLELLLNCREKIIFSYQHIDPVDYTPRLPSVVISELLDLFSEKQREQIQLNYPTLAFSSRYGRDTTIFTYRSEFTNAVQASSERFFQGKIQNVAIPNQISLSQLKAFFSHPVKYFLRHTLGLYSLLADENQTLHPPSELDQLQAYRWRQNMIDQPELDLQQWLTLMTESSQAPESVDAQGQIYYSSVHDALSVRNNLKVGEPDSVELMIDLKKQGLPVITGSLSHIYTNQRICVEAASDQPKRQLNGWIEHLALNLATGRACVSHYILKNRRYQFEPPEDSLRYLALLVEWFCHGLSSPLAMFPDISGKYAAGLAKGGDPVGLMAEAKRQYFKTPLMREALSEDVWNQYAFRGCDPFSSFSFDQASTQIWQPLQQHLKSYVRI